MLQLILSRGNMRRKCLTVGTAVHTWLVLRPKLHEISLNARQFRGPASIWNPFKMHACVLQAEKSFFLHMTWLNGRSRMLFLLYISSENRKLWLFKRFLHKTKPGRNATSSEIKKMSTKDASQPHVFVGIHQLSTMGVNTSRRSSPGQNYDTFLRCHNFPEEN